MKNNKSHFSNIHSFNVHYFEVKIIKKKKNHITLCLKNTKTNNKCIIIFNK